MIARDQLSVVLEYPIMHIGKSAPFSVSLLTTLLISACGGADIPSITVPVNLVDNGNLTVEPTDTGSDTNAEPDTGAALPVLSGRVADGYIVGATVCIDANENGECDEGEPSTVTGPGGVYQLDVQLDDGNKPVVAVIPEDAIDEDTGEAVGKKMVFSAPAGQPLFVSPLTTMVHAEMQQNPSMSLDEVESAVKETLGFDAEEEVSLFTDYVKESNGSSGDAEKFKYLHRAAQVVASMMKDIRAQVEQSATDQGLDVAGDPGIRAAIREIVRTEIQAVLPDIAQQVAALVDESENAPDAGSFNPDKIAGKLSPDSIDQNLVDRIESVKDKSELVSADMKTLLTQGVYWLDLVCEHDYGSVDGERSVNYESPDVENTDDVMVVLNDEGVPEPMYVEAGFGEQEHCFVEYGRVSLNDAGDRMEQELYVFDEDIGEWVSVDDVDTEGPSELTLVDGEWVEWRDEGPDGVVTFTEEGDAIVDSTNGKLYLSALTGDLSGKEVVHHVIQRGADQALADQAAEAGLFPEGSSVHKVSIKSSFQQYVLHHWEAYDDGENAQACADFNGNCNVVNSEGANGFEPVYSLDTIKAEAYQGITLSDVAYDDFHGVGMSVTLVATEYDDAGEAIAGYASWDYQEDQSFGPDDYEPFGEEEFEPADGEGDGMIDQFGPKDPLSEPLKEPLDEHNPDERFQEEHNVDCGIDESGAEDFGFDEPLAEMYPEDDLPSLEGQPLPCDIYVEEEPPVLFDENYEYTESDAFEALESEWYAITVDGVPMIKVHFPHVLKTQPDYREAAAVILAEQDGFVRRGTKFGGEHHDSQLTYNQSSFETLAPVLTDYLQR